MQRNAAIDSELVERIERMERTLDQQAAELREARKSIQTLTTLAGKRQKRIELLEGRLRQYEPVPDDSESQEGPDNQADHDEDHNRQDADPDRYSIDQATDPPKKRTKSKGGRKSLQDKIARTDRTEDIYPEDCDPALCQLVRTRVAHRLENGQAVYIAYNIYQSPDGRRGQVPELGADGEYGIEWAVIVAYLMYVVGMSMDRARAVIRFFTGLSLGRSQADALLNRLHRNWEPEFERLCELLAHALVVHVDESGWKVGKTSRSVWVFLTEKMCLYLFGVRKDLDTLFDMLDPDTFEGTVVSDDSALYRERFRKAQKCWAHLIRKAVRLTLLYPHKTQYQDVLAELVSIYRSAKRSASDGRLKDPGRKKRVAELESHIWTLCGEWWGASVPDNATADERTFINLNKEVLRLYDHHELFEFVLNPNVPPTNNPGEQAFRFVATERAAGRTSKTPAGSRRRSVLGSVFKTLSMQWDDFTLEVVLEHIGSVIRSGTSLFDRWFSRGSPSPGPAPADA